MNEQQLTGEIKELPLAEQVQLLDNLWVSIRGCHAQLTMADKRELDQRYREYQDGTANTKIWQQVHDNLRSRFE